MSVAGITCSAAISERILWSESFLSSGGQAIFGSSSVSKEVGVTIGPLPGRAFAAPCGGRSIVSAHSVSFLFCLLTFYPISGFGEKLEEEMEVSPGVPMFPELCRGHCSMAERET